MMNSANFMSIIKGRAIWRNGRWALALRSWIGHAAAVILRFKALAPYALIELVLPGGSLMALLLWLYRQRKMGLASGRYQLDYWRFSDPMRPKTTRRRRDMFSELL
jgi:hypothetical protein